MSSSWPLAQDIVDHRKLPKGNCQRNWVSLNRCPPYTEIFSKRRKIYSVCVESLSITVGVERHGYGLLEWSEELMLVVDL